MLVADKTDLRIVGGPLLYERRLGGTDTVIGMLAWSVAPRTACHGFGVLSVAHASNQRP